MNTQYYKCKGPYRHAWFDHDGSGFKAPEFGIALHFECSRCGTIRRDLVDRFRGDLLSRRYYYPEGYRDSREERPSTEDLRRFAIKSQRAFLKETKGKKKTSNG